MNLYKKLVIIPVIALTIGITSSSYSITPAAKVVQSYAHLFHKAFDSGLASGVTTLTKDFTTYTAYQTIALAKSLCSYAIAKYASLYNCTSSLFSRKQPTQSMPFGPDAEKQFIETILKKINTLPTNHSLIVTREKDDTISWA